MLSDARPSSCASVCQTGADVGALDRWITYIWVGNPTTQQYLDASRVGPHQMKALLTARGFRFRYIHEHGVSGFTGDNALQDGFEEVTVGDGGTVASFGRLLADTDLADRRQLVDRVIGSLRHCKYCQGLASTYG